MGTILTADELADLTGYKSAKWQIEWLRARGWIFELNRIGKPKVDREFYRSRMGNTGATESATQPNWGAI